MTGGSASALATIRSSVGRILLVEIGVEDLERYAAEGFVIFPSLIDTGLISDACQALRRIGEGIYDLGVAPYRRVPEPPDTCKVWRIDQPHIASRAVYDLITTSGLGRMAAALMGAAGAQAWYVHSLFKPSNDLDSKVGWHQDGQYVDFFSGDFVTAWIALSAVEENSGPMTYIRGSHKTDFVRASGFSSEGSIDDLERRVRRGLRVPWSERKVVGQPGTVAFHHSRLVHGSRPNTGGWARESITVHLRSEKNTFTRSRRYNFVTEHADDRGWSPILFGHEDLFDRPICH